ncbi:MAG TPA: GNAT family N-acetyltransferase [Vicinamibacteria bacterium]|nr:GNAT family N-acetyltransferase [Vicinamibacteria bacterium]
MTGGFTVVRTEERMADELAALQEACFPTLATAERIRAEHYRAHVRVFPEGQHVVVETATGRVVATSTDFRTAIDFAHYQHRYMDAVGGNWLTTHRPDGDWLYGADVGVHPEFRRRGLATLLYGERQALCRRLGLQGHVEGAMPKGYHFFRDTMPIEAYVARVVRGEIDDPTLTVQLRRGYHVYGMIPEYLEDPSAANYGVFVVWTNPDRYRAADR